MVYVVFYMFRHTHVEYRLVRPRCPKNSFNHGWSRVGIVNQWYARARSASTQVWDSLLEWKGCHVCSEAIFADEYADEFASKSCLFRYVLGLLWYLLNYPNMDCSACWMCFSLFVDFNPFAVIALITRVCLPRFTAWLAKWCHSIWILTNLYHCCAN